MAKHKKGGTGAGGGKRGGGRLSSALAQVQATEARLKRAKHAEKVKEAQSQRHKANRGGQSTAKGKEKARHERCLFENGERILLVGEGELPPRTDARTRQLMRSGAGNFSFAASVVTHHGIGGHLLTATCYDSETVLHAKYPDVNSHLATLRAAGAEVVFDVDAGALDTDKRTRGRRWDRVAWLFPHIGAGIKDEARNVSANQVEIMLFLRAVQSVLQEGAEQRWNVRQVSPDEDEDVELGDPNTAAASTGRPGRVSIVLRNAPPYTLWDVPCVSPAVPALVVADLAHSLVQLAGQAWTDPRSDDPIPLPSDLAHLASAPLHSRPFRSLRSRCIPWLLAPSDRRVEGRLEHNRLRGHPDAGKGAREGRRRRRSGGRRADMGV